MSKKFWRLILLIIGQPMEHTRECESCIRLGTSDENGLAMEWMLAVTSSYYGCWTFEVE